jgi:hypothetical protein
MCRVASTILLSVKKKSKEISKETEEATTASGEVSSSESGEGLLSVDPLESRTVTRKFFSADETRSY